MIYSIKLKLISSLFIDQTPERIEIQSLTDAEDQFDEMDEDEWTDRNFGNSIIMDGDARYLMTFQTCIKLYILHCFNVRSGEDDDSSIEEGECEDIDDEKEDSDSGNYFFY